MRTTGLTTVSGNGIRDWNQKWDPAWNTSIAWSNCLQGITSMLSGGMAGQFLWAYLRNPIGSGKRLPGAKGRRSPFSPSPVFLGNGSMTTTRFHPSVAIGTKQTGYIVPDPSSRWVNQPHASLSNQYWILTTLIRRQGYVSIGGGQESLLNPCARLDSRMFPGMVSGTGPGSGIQPEIQVQCDPWGRECGLV